MASIVQILRENSEDDRVFAKEQALGTCSGSVLVNEISRWSGIRF